VKKPALILISAVLSGILTCVVANADGPGPGPGPGPPPPLPPPDALTILVCNDREDPSIGATLVFDLDRKRLVRSTNSGPNILFDDHNVPVKVGPGTIEWEVANNTYTLNRATLELDVIGRVYICQIARKQL
jgi:hypothetical protein